MNDEDRIDELKQIIDNLPVSELKKVTLEAISKNQKLQDELILKYSNSSNDVYILTIEDNVDEFLDHMIEWFPINRVLEEESPINIIEILDYEFFDQFKGPEWYDDMVDYSIEKLHETERELDEVLKLLKEKFVKDKDIDSLITILGGMISVLDPYLKESVDSDEDYYHQKLASLIIFALDNKTLDKRSEILEDIIEQYFDLDNDHFYTYTMAMVIKNFLGESYFDKLDLERTKLELDNALSNHSLTEFEISEYKKKIDSLEKKIESE